MTKEQLFDMNRSEGILSIPVSLVGKGVGEVGNSKDDFYFVMTADGSGMVNAGIHNGDTMVFYRTEVAPNGAIVAVLMDGGELACRRYLRSGKAVRFRREDGTTPDRKTKDYEIVGVLVSIVRKFNYCA